MSSLLLATDEEDEGLFHAWGRPAHLQQTDAGCLQRAAHLRQPRVRLIEEDAQHVAVALHLQHARLAIQHADGSTPVVWVQLHQLPRQAGQDGLRRVAADQPPGVHQPHALATLGLVHVRRADDDGHSLKQEVGQDVPELPPRDGIDAGGGFVEQQQIGLVDQGTGQGEFLLHTAGEPIGAAVAELGQAGEVQQALGPCAPLRSVHLVQVGEEGQVLIDAEVAVQAELLRHVADAGLDGLRLGAQVVAQHLGPAGGDIEQASQQAQRGGLARAVRPHQAKELTARHLQVETVHRAHTAEIPRQPLGTDDVIVHGLLLDQPYHPQRDQRPQEGLGHRCQEA